MLLTEELPFVIKWHPLLKAAYLSASDQRSRAPAIRRAGRRCSGLERTGRLRRSIWQSDDINVLYTKIVVAERKMIYCRRKYGAE